MANAVVGRVLLMPKGNYSASVSYSMLDIVRYENKSWVCKQACTGQAPQAGDYWQLMASDGTNGTNSYIWVRYSESADGTGFVATPTPTRKYMGVYAGTSSTAPTDKTAYAWSKFMGEDGKGISSIAKTNTSGLVDTYTITYSDSTTSTFNVTNGKDGSQNYYGTLITGNSTTPTAYATGITMARVNDSYTNTTTFFEYRCTVEGNATTAKWVYVGSKKGADGLGSGDMNKSTYDTNNNGIVDNAEKLGGKLPSHYLYSLPIGGTSLGGVKNGGNVTINEDGEMNAEVGTGDMLASDYATNGTTGVVDTSNRLRKYSTTNSGTTYINQWTKLAELTFTAIYQNENVIFSVINRNAPYGMGIFSLIVRVGDTFSTHSHAILQCISADKNFKPRVGTIKIVYTAPKYELWYNPTGEYSELYISILNESNYGVGFTWLENQPYQATQPAGTVVTATLMDDYLITDLTAETAIADADYFMMHDTSAVSNRKTLWSSIKSTLKAYFDTLYDKTASTTVKGGVKIGNGLVIASEVARLDKYTFTDTTIATTDFATYTPSGAIETDLDTAGYGYKVHKALANVTANHEANVVFGAIEADSGNYASIAITEAGYVNIYAKEVPSSAITIPTIDCMYKGV